MKGGASTVVSANAEQAIIDLHAQNCFVVDSSTKVSVCSFLRKDAAREKTPPGPSMDRDAKTHYLHAESSVRTVRTR